MTRTPDPADGAPRRRRGEPAGDVLQDAAGRPALVSPVAGAGTSTSGQPGSPTPLADRARTSSGATPRPGRRDGTPEEVPQTPAGRASEPPGGNERAPAGSRGYRGKAFTDAAKAEQSKQAKASRAKRGLYVTKARRGVQAASGPGMVRRMPPPQTPGDAA